MLCLKREEFRRAAKNHFFFCKYWTLHIGIIIFTYLSYIATTIKKEIKSKFIERNWRALKLFLYNIDKKSNILNDRIKINFTKYSSTKQWIYICFSFKLLTPPPKKNHCNSFYDHFQDYFALYSLRNISTLKSVPLKENISSLVNFTHFREKMLLFAFELIFVSSSWRVYIYVKFDI